MELKKKIVTEEVEKAGLETNSISLETIRSQVKRDNVTAYNPFEMPLIANIEPIICDFCIRLGKMGEPLTFIMLNLTKAKLHKSSSEVRPKE
jgi:hypothetical protein